MSVPVIPARARAALLSAAVVALSSAVGCRSPKEIWSAAAEVEGRPGEIQTVAWDTDLDGAADYRQFRDPATGVVDTLQFRGPDGLWEKPFRPAEDKSPKRTLVVMLDGMPHSLLDELWAEGRFRLFHRPSKVVSVFPSMTDPAYGEMLCANPVKGYEPLFFDRSANRFNGGTTAYLTGENEPWRPVLDYRQSYLVDAVAYVYPQQLAYNEVLKSYERWRDAQPQQGVWYFAGSDAMGHMAGWRGCKEYLTHIDKLLERVYWESRGRIEMVMFADHGNSFVPSARVPLLEYLRREKLHLADRLTGSSDTCVVPTLGMISSVAMYVDTEEARARAERALAKTPGVDLFAWRRDGRYYVRSRDQIAEIEPRGVRRFAYRPIAGDPLRLKAVVGRMQAAGRMDSDGFADEDDWLAATIDHPYPDAPQRIVRGLDGSLVTNPADILISLADGWYWGDYSIDIPAGLNGTHGALAAGHTNTFFASTVAPGPKFFRQADMLSVINRTSFRFVPQFPGVNCGCLRKQVPALPA